MTTRSNRNWSKVTLGKELAEFLAITNLTRFATVGQLVDAIKDAIVEEQGVVFVFGDDFIDTIKETVTRDYREGSDNP